MELILIAAMTRDRVIGNKGSLPWDIPEEYKQFLDKVRGHVVMMGRTSYEIFGKDLDGSDLIVVSRTVRQLPGVAVCPTIDRAVSFARRFGSDKKLFCGGGASIYKQTLPLADSMYLSIIRKSYVGDAYFPEFDENDWEIAEREEFPRYDYFVYRRR